jgi:hypothetical protein
MGGDKESSKLNGVIDPEHLLQAIKNSVEHCDENAHGVTGLTFKHYTIVVRKRTGLSWVVECKFKARDTDQCNQQEAPARSLCRRSSKRR